MAILLHGRNFKFIVLSSIYGSSQLYILLYFLIVAKPKYYWQKEDNFENRYLEAQVGDSPIVHFTVVSEPLLAEDAEHTLTKDSKAATRRFIIQNNSLRFKKVRLEDSGIYTISCSNSFGLVCEDTIELDVIPAPKSLTPPPPQSSQGEQITLILYTFRMLCV